MAATEHYIITDYERLASCQLVAVRDSVIEPYLSDQGWVFFMRSYDNKFFSSSQIQSFEENNYQGLLLINEQKKSFILVHREMQPEPQNVANCLMIGIVENEPPIVENALAMCDMAIKFVNQYEGFKLYHTGFSMGGFLAQITASYCNHYLRNHNNAIGYDCPGATPFIEQRRYDNNRENIVVYLTSPNLINTATLHYGYVRQISYYESHIKKSKVYDLSNNNEFEITLGSFSSTALNIGLFRYTLETHNLNELCNELKKNKKLDFNFHYVQCWPKANNSFMQIPDISSAKINTTYELISETGCIVFDLVCYRYGILERVKPFLEALQKKGGQSFSQVKHSIHPVVIYNKNEALIETIEQYIARFRLVLCLTTLIIEMATANKQNPEVASRNQTTVGSSKLSGDKYIFMPKPRKKEASPNTQQSNMGQRFG